MWGVDPKRLCRRHLLGEHVEMHMFAGALAKGQSLSGYIEKGLVETDHIGSRHDVLAAELLRRGYKHRSPIRLPNGVIGSGIVNVDRSKRDLWARCRACKEKGGEKEDDDRAQDRND